jgi:hypothetical protein
MGDSVASGKSGKSKKGKNEQPSTGEFTFSDGSTYSGDFAVVNGTKMRQGLGTYTSARESYTGGWEKDLQSGEGTYRFNSGSVYEGSFSQGAFHGNGKYTFPDGAFYEGEWNMSKMHGQGSYTDPKQQVYAGTFYNGLYDNGVSYVSVRTEQ